MIGLSKNKKTRLLRQLMTGLLWVGAASLGLGIAVAIAMS